MSRAPRGLAAPQREYYENLRMLERPRRGVLVIWSKPGKIIRPTTRCSHTFEAIIQPGDFVRIKNCWFSHCGKCQGLITGEAQRRVVPRPTKL